MAEPQQTISPEVAAALIMCTQDWLNKLVRMGYITRVGRGQYTVPNVVQGYIRFLKDEGRRTSKSAADSRVRDARAEEIELRTMEKRGVLKQQAEEAALALCDHVLGPLRSDVYAIPARVTQDLELRRKIEQALDAALTSAADRAGGFDPVAGAGGSPAAPGPAKPAGRLGKAKSDVPRKRGRPRAA